ncbi:MAG: sulfotransferase [Actinomycetota bacterium]
MDHAPLTPLLLQVLSGRSGTTLLMQLLGTSPDVAFDRIYPFENRYLAYLLHIVEPSGTDWDAEDHPSQVELLRSPGLIGPVPFVAQVDRGALRSALLRGAWGGFSELVRRDRPNARYYAEKMIGSFDPLGEAGIHPRIVHLLRDPRDVFSSIRAFDEKRGFFGFGRRADQAEDQFLAQWIDQVRRRAADLEGQRRDGHDLAVVRYEELVTDLAGAAARLGAWLELDLDAGAVVAARPEMEHHMTSSTPQGSVGRWRDDLPRSLRRRIERELRPELRAFGY